MAETTLAALGAAVKDGNRSRTVELVNAALSEGVPALSILNDGLVPGIDALGEAFRGGQAYLPEILVAARAMNAGAEVLKPHLSRSESRGLGTVVIGTVRGDLHDIGKNLVRMMLDCAGFNVVDLGADVDAAAFVAGAREHGADVIAMSALLTTTMTYMPEVIAEVKRTGLQARVLVGGAAVSRGFADEIGAEGYAEDCLSAVDEARRLVREPARG